ncbi:MAG: ribosome maturation factor RimM [Candidatus Hydrogenedentota bacterium]
MGVARVEIGTVRSVLPSRRELRVAPGPGHQHEFEALEWLRVVVCGGRELRCRVLAAAPAGDTVRVTLAPGVTRDQVASMRHARIVLTPEEQTPRAPDDWTMAELMGMAVVDQHDAPLGVVAKVYETPANAAITIAKPDGTRMLLPAIPEVVTRVDLETNTIHVGDTAPYAVEDG